MFWAIQSERRRFFFPLFLLPVCPFQFGWSRFSTEIFFIFNFRDFFLALNFEVEFFFDFFSALEEFLVSSFSFLSFEH